MKRFIKSTLVLKTLDTVQTSLGYPIACSQAPPNWRGGDLAVEMNSDDKWFLIYKDLKFLIDAYLAHELLHLALRIEGWPTYRIVYGGHYSDTAKEGIKIAVDNILNLLDHIEIAQRLPALGQPDIQDYQRLAEKTLSDYKDVCGKAPELQGLDFAALTGLDLAVHLIRPEVHATTKSDLRNLPAINRYISPQSVVVAGKILKTLGAFPKVEAATYDRKVREIQRIIGLPEKVLQEIRP